MMFYNEGDEIPIVCNYCKKIVKATLKSVPYITEYGQSIENIKQFFCNECNERLALPPESSQEIHDKSIKCKASSQDIQDKLLYLKGNVSEELYNNLIKENSNLIKRAVKLNFNISNYSLTFPDHDRHLHLSARLHKRKNTFKRFERYTNLSIKIYFEKSIEKENIECNEIEIKRKVWQEENIDILQFIEDEKRYIGRVCCLFNNIQNKNKINNLKNRDNLRKESSKVRIESMYNKALRAKAMGEKFILSLF